MRYQWFVAGICAASAVPVTLSPRATSGAAHARQTSVAGHVVAGGPLGGVSVTASPERGGIVRETTTGSDGAYQFDDLPVGVYRLDFDLINFDIVRRNRVAVSRDVSARVDVTMHVSAMCECIEHWPGPDPRVELRERVGRVATSPTTLCPTLGLRLRAHQQRRSHTPTVKDDFGCWFRPGIRGD